MSELLELLDAGPMIALAIAAVLMLAVVVVMILQARRIGRLERRLAERGESAEEAPLRRIAELQSRHQAALGVDSGTALRPIVTVGAVVLVLVLAIGGAWFFITGDGGEANDVAQTQGEATAQTETAGEDPQPPDAPDPVAATTVPASIPPITDTGAFSVKVFNASGVPGAAGDGVGPRLETEGYNVLRPENFPGAETDLPNSVVMYNGSDSQPAAWNVARVLGIDRAPPLEGLTADQIEGADVIVVVGLDLAQNLVSGATP